jgi:hypothetical protein
MMDLKDELSRMWVIVEQKYAVKYSVFGTKSQNHRGQSCRTTATEFIEK